MVAVVPWWGFQGHTHWAKVGWIPFVSPPIKAADIVINLLLFVPFGAAFVAHVPGRRGLLWVLVAAATLSLFGEWTQLYSHTRFPSATDVVCNVAGAAIGALLVERHRRR